MSMGMSMRSVGGGGRYIYFGGGLLQLEMLTNRRYSISDLARCVRDLVPRSIDDDARVEWVDTPWESTYRGNPLCSRLPW
jgi:hypothetical protein